MEVQAYELYILHILSLSDYILHIFHGYSKLVFGKPRRYVGMCVCPDIGIYTECHPCHLTFRCGNLINDSQLRDTLYIEAENILINGKVYFFITLADTGKNNFAGRKTSINSSLNFSSAYTVCPQPCLTYDIQYLRIGVCLDRIMHAETFILAGLSVDCAQCLTQQIRIIIIKWSIRLVEFIQGENAFHPIFFFYR